MKGKGEKKTRFRDAVVKKNYFVLIIELRLLKGKLYCIKQGSKILPDVKIKQFFVFY